jgi:hypothetical protein
MNTNAVKPPITKLPVLSKTGDAKLNRLAASLNISSPKKRNTKAANRYFASTESSRDRGSKTYNARPATACPSFQRRGHAQTNDDDLAALREKALLRVINSKRKEKQLREMESMKQKMLQEEKRISRQLKFSQKERERGEIYAINRILKRRFDEQYQRFLESGKDDMVMCTKFHTSV